MDCKSRKLSEEVSWKAEYVTNPANLQEGTEQSTKPDPGSGYWLPPGVTALHSANKDIQTSSFLINISSSPPGDGHGSSTRADVNQIPGNLWLSPTRA